MVAFGSRSIGKVYERLREAEHWGRKVTGTVFIFVGVYYSLVYICEVI
jgi:hypothetical protein